MPEGCKGHTYIVVSEEYSSGQPHTHTLTLKYFHNLRHSSFICYTLYIYSFHITHTHGLYILSLTHFAWWISEDSRIPGFLTNINLD